MSDEQETTTVLPVAEEPDERVKISNEEWFEISTALECHHAVFYKIWQMGKPVFTKEVKTAAVQFDETGDFIYFHFNPKFWKRLSFYGKLFVICHEALHVILNHGIRIRDTGINRQAANSALDVVVNHSLCRGFGFDRKKIDQEIVPIFQEMAVEEGDDPDKAGLCWVDTVFKQRNPLPPDDEMFEFYYNLFERVYGAGYGDASTLDDHDMMGVPSDDWGKVIDKLSEGLTDEEKQPLKPLIDKHFQKKPQDQKNQKAGSGTGGHWVFANVLAVKKKKKWETVIRRWSRKFIRESDRDMEQWARLNRRLVMLPQDMMLPSEMEIEDEEKDKRRIKVYFFLDTSGSCWGLKDRFFAAANSLPEKRFDIRLFCFDTVVKETTLASRKIYGGGGTSFAILEAFIQKEMKNEGTPYPQAVFVITDGYGDTIKPEQPDKWYWFITQGGTQSYIDRDCNFFKLEDYE